MALANASVAGVTTGLELKIEDTALVAAVKFAAEAVSIFVAGVAFARAAGTALV